MSADPYTAVWVSHTSISDFLACPRAYYLKNMYRDPKSGHKIKLVSPPLSLGKAIHEVLDSLSKMPTEDRFKESPVMRFHELWKKVSGKKGGFANLETEQKYKERGEHMLNRLMQHRGPLERKAVKIRSDKDSLIYYWFSEKDGIILCGKIDWLEYLPDFDAVHIIDFKTNKNDENDDSLQLPIYYLLTKNCQKRHVEKLSYWYIERNNEPTERPLPDVQKSTEEILTIAKKIKLTRQLNVFKCPQQTGCRVCKPYEKIIKGEAEFVGLDEYNNDLYILEGVMIDRESEIL